MIRYLQGYYRIRLTGAAPFRALNEFSRQNIAFRDLSHPDELTVLCSVMKKDREAAEVCALKAMCTAQIIEEHSFVHTFGGLRRRLVLLAGLVLACFFALFFTHFVWFVRIEGNGQIPTQLLRQQLEEVGVRFGAWGPSLDMEHLCAQLQSRIGKLAWISVNRNGGVVTATVTERDPEPENLDRREFYNLVAVRPGILTQVNVYNGFCELKPGDAVVTGQLLVSGMADWVTHTQITRALGEIYAQTLHQKSFCLPAETAEKCYTDREKKQVSLVIGQKRIKIFGNSGISYASCDKMTYRRVLTLPGDNSFPVCTETVIYREYTLKPKKLPRSLAEQLLTDYSAQYVQNETVAGQILSREDSFSEENGAYTLHASVSCEEMIARARPGTLDQEVTDGTDNQCGAD